MKKDFMINGFAALYSKLGGNYWRGRYWVDKKARKLVGRNIKFKDIHKGQRCFVLGNAPSLREIDFDLLKKEYVFTVNSVMLMDGYDKLNINYHFWMDPVNFNITSDGVEVDISQMVKNMSEIGRQKDIECFVPYFAYDFVTDNNLDLSLNINYIYAGKPLKANSKTVVLNKMTYGVNLTIQYAIMTAIYMGFSEIYLIGVEETAIIGLLQDGYVKHAYSKEDAAHVKVNKKWVEETVTGYAKAFIEYRLLMELCLRNGILLRNCTPNSLVESIPYIDFNELKGISN